MFDPTDNPYMPRNLQGIRLALDPNDLAFPHPGDGVSRRRAEDDSSIVLIPLEEDEFPRHFKQFGSPPRLFHSHGSYVLPVDSNETKRQEAQHILLRMIIGSNYDAPIRELLNATLVGARSSIYAPALGIGSSKWPGNFPMSNFVADLGAPIQTRYPPENVVFEIGDVTGRLSYPDASVDVVHARMTCLSVRGRYSRISARGLAHPAPWRDIPQRGMGHSPNPHPEHPWFLELEDYIPQTITFYDFASTIVPTLAPDISMMIHQNGSFERPVLRRRAIPISAPYAASSNGLRFVSEVMERVTQGYADALVAGRRVPLVVAESFKAELSERSGIVCVYQTVFARKSPN
ncbi:hypothetical protein EI94DRAFT_1805225 [Lactarius quietus]|nr:hypothetical protein EI94DRAFT_1805225 [Lactarius quietus]